MTIKKIEMIENEFSYAVEKVSNYPQYGMNSKTNKRFGLHLDSLGFSASFICAVHCAAMPMLLTVLSLSPLSFLVNPLFETMIIILSVMIGVSSLLPGYLKHHKKISPVVILVTGFILIFTGHFIVTNDYEAVVTPTGAMLVAISHLLNWKFSKNHSCEISY